MSMTSLDQIAIFLNNAGPLRVVSGRNVVGTFELVVKDKNDIKHTIRFEAFGECDLVAHLI